MKIKNIMLFTISIFIAGFILSPSAFPSIEFSQEDTIYFNNLKNCTPTYINSNGVKRNITGIKNGKCVFSEDISSDDTSGMPNISLSCQIPQNELKTLVMELLNTLQKNNNINDSAKIKYETMIKNYCDMNIGK